MPEVCLVIHCCWLSLTLFISLLFTLWTVLLLSRNPEWPWFSCDTLLLLLVLLGKWLYPATELRRQWHTYYVLEDRLYIFQNNRYDHHLPCELEFDLDVHGSNLVLLLPFDALPVVSTEATEEDFWEITSPAYIACLYPLSVPRIVPRQNPFR